MNQELWREQQKQTTRRAIRIISAIPFTRAIALTGSQSEGRATKTSDIDFFIQVEPNWLWSTRFFVTLFIQLAGIRRTDHNIAGKICLNWYATFDAPAKQKGRVYQYLWQQEPYGTKLFFEKMISALQGRYLEKILKQYQISRIERDPRTHMKDSQVRHSDTELGFHPPKRS